MFMRSATVTCVVYACCCLKWLDVDKEASVLKKKETKIDEHPYLEEDRQRRKATDFSVKFGRRVRCSASCSRRNV